MMHVFTKERLKVPPHGIGPSTIIVPFERVDELRALFDAHKIRYEVDEEFIREAGDPDVTFITFSRRTDPAEVQELLDSIP
jgi:hypothetical protein